MTRWKAALAGLVLVAGPASGARAQLGLPTSPFAPIPGAGAAAVPGAAALPGGLSGAGAGLSGGLGGAASGVPAAAGGGQTIWNFFGISKANCAACRAKLCQSQLGMMLNNGMQPLGALAGGFLPSLCPPVSQADLAAAAGGPAGAQSVAAKIKMDEAQAKARVAAVEYLGTVDCHYWPEAEAALIERLRTDRNECVRFAAARVLGTGCCCTKKTVAALTLALTASDEDGNPSETSERVRAASFAALQNCQGRVRVPEPLPLERPEEPARPEEPGGVRPASYEAPGVRLSAYYTDTLRTKPMAMVQAEARRALANNGQAPRGWSTLPTGQRSLRGVLAKSSAPSPPATPPPTELSGSFSPSSPDNSRALARVDRSLMTASGPSSEVDTTESPVGRPSGSRSLFGILKSSLKPRTSTH